MNINLYFDQFNRVEPVKETKQMDNHIDNPSGKSFAEMIVEAQLERERNNNLQNQKDSEEKSESENNKMIVDHISLSYSQMMLNSLILSSKKDEDKKRK